MKDNHKTCIVCGKERKGDAKKYCSWECYLNDPNKNTSGKANNNWRGGMPKCIDCGKELSSRYYTRCKSCARKGPLNPYHQKVIKEHGELKRFDKIKRVVRNSYKYRQGRSDVYTRDNFICQNCFQKGRLEAHHIVSLAHIIRQEKIETIVGAFNCERLFDINNGITLCQECHSLTKNYKGRNHKLLKENKL